MKQLTEKQLKNFWDKVDKTTNDEGCWLWIGAKSSTGRGSFKFEGTMKSAHRVSWFIKYGYIPKGTQINHAPHYICGSPLCVSPKHLKLGDYKTNSVDSINDGTSGKGSKSHKAKLSENHVDMIKNYLKAGLKCRKVAEYFGVSKHTIAAIKSEKNWGWLRTIEY